MALSGNHTGSAVGGITLRVNWSARQNATDIANNRSYVTANAYMIVPSGYAISSSASKNGNIIIDGTTHNFTKVLGSIGGGTHLVGTYSRYVNHTSDGSKSFSLSASFSPNVTLSGVGWIGTLTTGSQSYTLDTIPRASSIGTITGRTIGSPITVNISRQSNDFVHRVWYRLPSQIWQLSTNNATTSHTFTIPYSQASYLPNSSSATLEIAVQTTTSTGTYIGGELNTTITVSLPQNSTTRPTLPTPTALDTNSITIGLTGNSDHIVQSKSNLRVYVGQTSAKYGATIQNITATIGNTSRSKTFNATTTPSSYYDFSQPNISGWNYINVTVRDSRGFTTTNNIQVYSFPYAPPVFISYSADRLNSFEDASTLSFKISIAEIVYSSRRVEYWIRQEGATSWGTTNVVTSATSWHLENQRYIGQLDKRSLGDRDNNRTFQIRLRVTDTFGTYEQLFTLDAAKGLVVIDKDGWSFEERVKGISGSGTKSWVATMDDIVGGGSVSWWDITSKPDTATRWPTWNEVSSKPSTFPPSSHSHSEYQVTGGSNSLGNWVKYPDGTMIVNAISTESVTTNAVGNTGHISLIAFSGVNSFPEDFHHSSTPSLIGCTFEHGQFIVGSDYWQTTTYWRYRILLYFRVAMTGSTATMRSTWIGRWKA